MASLEKHFQVNPENLVSDSKIVFKGVNYRITVLSERLIRFEYSLDGNFYEKQELVLPTEEEMVEWLKDNLRTQLQKYEKKVKTGEISSYLNDVALEYFENSIEKAATTDLPDYVVNLDDDMILIEMDGENLIIKDVTIRYMSHDKYKVYITKMPINKFSLEQLKFLSRKIHKIKEPKFPLNINPGISKEEVENAKELIKRLKV